MATAYHRRPLLDALDIAAVAHAKIGRGSGWQGYYMYAGGPNPGPDLQESHATGYPNDLPEFDYDFHAPIGAAGVLAPSHAELRRQHAFLAAFGERLAAMASTLPDVMPRASTTATPSAGRSAPTVTPPVLRDGSSRTCRSSPVSGARFAVGLDRGSPW